MGFTGKTHIENFIGWLQLVLSTIVKGKVVVLIWTVFFNFLVAMSEFVVPVCLQLHITSPRLRDWTHQVLDAFQIWPATASFELDESFSLSHLWSTQQPSTSTTRPSKAKLRFLAKNGLYNRIKNHSSVHLSEIVRLGYPWAADRPGVC